MDSIGELNAVQGFPFLRTGHNDCFEAVFCDDANKINEIEIYFRKIEIIFFPNINDTVPQTMLHHPPQVSLNSSFNRNFSDLSGDSWCQQYHPNRPSP